MIFYNKIKSPELPPLLSASENPYSILLKEIPVFNFFCFYGIIAENIIPAPVRCHAKRGQIPTEPCASPGGGIMTGGHGIIYNKNSGIPNDTANFSLYELCTVKPKPSPSGTGFGSSANSDTSASHTTVVIIPHFDEIVKYF